MATLFENCDESVQLTNDYAMNQLPGILTHIETVDQLSLVQIDVTGLSFTTLVIDTPQTVGYLRMGEAVQLVFKETEVSIGKALTGGLSTRNRIPARIEAIQSGQLLTQLSLGFRGHRIHSLITTGSARMLGLQVGDAVEGLVKAHAITLMKP